MAEVRALSTARLQKVLAHAGISSRRKAEQIIASGRVTVNGQLVREMGVKVDLARDTIAVDGIVVDIGPREYWMLHKPPGVITTVEDPWGRPTARELIPSRARLYPVGRLDADSSGLLLFTNDGELAFRLTHPRFEHDKTYHVRISGRVRPETLQQLRDGVLLDGRRTLPAQVEFVRTSNGATWLSFVLREGRKRQIRRMCAAVGHAVERLVRVRVGPLELGDLPPGQARRLTPAERLALKAYVAGDTSQEPPLTPGRQPAEGPSRSPLRAV